VGAFNHLHVFVDPDPDPETGFAERERLFHMPRSTWADYDPEQISAGGGVFERSAKSVPLSPEVRELLGVDKKSLPPSELIKALLEAKVDLLFFGGIGTYIKATDESHAATGDRQNDEVRVDARRLRCRVIGEGANLGLTQRGRIEYALHGGRVNTDFLDNSAGVDCSDHEVNIKVLLGEPLSQGRLTLEKRNALLERMTDEVAELVLQDNYLQSQAISVAEAQGGAVLDQHEALIRDLERERNLDRELEALPDDETLDRRRSDDRGLTRPEISVLLAYAKIRLYEELLASDLPEDPQLVRDLYRYFPAPLRESFRPDIERHRLRREIIATFVTNSIVNRVGPSFLTRMAAETSRGVTDIARAYILTREIFRLHDTWKGIEALDNRVPAEVQTGMILEVGRLVERGTMWFLRRGRHPLQIAHEAERFLPSVTRLTDSLEDLLLARDRDKLRSRAERHGRHGVPVDLARKVAGLEFLGSTLDIVEIAQGYDSDVADVARIYFRIGARFRLEWMRVAAQKLAAESHWAKSAVEALTEDLFGHQSALTRSVLATAEAEGSDGALRRWLAERKGAVVRLDELFDELRGAPAPDLAMLTVVNHQLRLLRADG
jgi:glutamate dehydrogenase